MPNLMIPDDAVSLCAEYAPGGAVNGESPTGYTVTARDGALVARCPDYPTALRYFHRWSEPEGGTT